MKRSENFVMRELEGECILIPRGHMTERLNRLLTLNETAAWLYSHVEEDISFEELFGRFAAEYETDGSDEETKEDIRAALSQMVKLGILNCY